MKLSALPPHARRIVADQLQRQAPRVKHKAKRPTGPDARFIALVRDAGLPAPTAEHKFHPSRKWRFDYAWPEHRVALEVEGGVWSGGRHTRGSGFIGDMAKYNEAARLGWRVVRTTPGKLRSEATIGLLVDLVGGAAA